MMAPLPAIPPHLHGVPVVAVICCYAGPVEEGERVVRPMKEFGTPLLDLCQPKQFQAHQAMFDPSFPSGWWYYFRSCDIAELSNDVIDIVAERAPQMTSPLTAFPIFHLGGAISRVGEDETAFNGRGSGHTININATTATREGFEEEREWSRSFWTALQPYHTSVYVNFLMDEGEDRIRQAYGSERYDRLKGLKRRYDPENFFRLNQNIPPD
jgi:Berberine and berberine like